MDIRQCARCSKLFHYMGNRNCPECVRALDDIFLEVRNYLDDHPGANMDDVCVACEADEDDVLRWLREGRLILSSESASLLKCQVCGTPIKSGRYCDTCAAKVIGQLESTAQQLGGGRKGKGHEESGRSHVRIER